ELSVRKLENRFHRIGKPSERKGPPSAVDDDFWDSPSKQIVRYSIQASLQPLVIDIKFVDRPPVGGCFSLHNLDVAGRLLPKAGGDNRTCTAAACYGPAPVRAVIRDVDLVAAGIIIAAARRVHNDFLK